MVESYKSGFEPPGDVEFEDYGQAMKRTASETSLSNSREAKEKPAGKSKGKLWPFIKNKNKVTHECPPNTEPHLQSNAQQSLTGFSTFHFTSSLGGQLVLWGDFCGVGWRAGYYRLYHVVLVLSCNAVATEIYVFNVTFVVSVTFLALVLYLI